MKASVGDRIIIASTHLDEPARDGRVVEVRNADGSPPYVVEWSDSGEQTLVFPGPDTHIHSAGEGPRASQKTWTVHVHITERGDETTAAAVLGVEAPDQLESEGRSRRNPTDPASPVIGDEVAVARALRQLADRLLATAESNISSSTGSQAHLFT